jgi:hypothetical protein
MIFEFKIQGNNRANAQEVVRSVDISELVCNVSLDTDFLFIFHTELYLQD